MKINVIGYSHDEISMIKEFDEEQFYYIVKFVNDLDVDMFDIYEDIYKSSYNTFPDELQKQILDNKIQSLKEKCPLLETEKQGYGYEWIYLNRKDKGEEAYRYYFGINPLNMYKLVYKLTEKFIENKVTVSFKYQQKSKKNAADRIILYTNSKYKNEVEKVLLEVYKENKELFENSERILPWIYESKIPNVYFAPEGKNHSKSYGEKFAYALLDSKKIFHYLYQEDKVKNKEQLETLKKIVLSTMLRTGLFITTSDKRIITDEQGIKTFYDKKNNCLTNNIDEKNGNYYEVVYDSSIEAKKAFLENFYSVKNVPNQKGVKVRALSRQDRNREIYNFLYPQNNNNIKKH